MRSTALVVFAVGVFVACNARGDDPPEPVPKPLEVSGRTEAETVTIFPRVSGYVEKLAVREGEEVKRGAVLAEIDSRFYKIELDAAKAKLVRADAQKKVAELRVTRVKKLVASGALAKEELVQAELERDAAEAEVMVAKAEIERAELFLSWTRVVAPIDGRVSQVKLIAGNLVRADRDAIVTLVRPDPLFVMFEVDEIGFLNLRRELKDGKPSVTVGFATDKGFPHKAELTGTSGVIDPKTGTIRLKATMPNLKGEYLPGMSARVRISPQAGK